jgi:hypothetical protein
MGKPPASLPKELQGERFVSQREAAALRGVSVYTIRRDPDLPIYRLSQGRIGHKLRDVLNLPRIEESE